MTNENTKRDDTKWKRAALLASQQYPDLKKSSDEFHKVTLGIYKNMRRSFFKVKKDLLRKSAEIVALYCEEPSRQRALIEDTYIVLYHHLATAKKAANTRKI